MESVPGDYSSYLSHLVRFRHLTVSLKINEILYPFSHEDMMAPPTSFLETEPAQGTEYSFVTRCGLLGLSGRQEGLEVSKRMEFDFGHRIVSLVVG
jgi:hypothetical protein